MFSYTFRCLLLLAMALAPLSEARATLYSLTILTNGSGTISRNPTNSAYPSGSVVTITANPSAGWYFTGWTGDEISTTNPLNVLMSSNKVITANFQNVPVYSLTISTNGMGSVSLNPTGGSYASNSIVTATAVPATGWIFVNWSGDASGSTNPLSITMSSNKTVAANFAQPPVVDQPPQDATVNLGETVVFDVHAIGSPLLSYQWSFNGLNLEGATDTSLVLTDVQLKDEGIYSVTVSNPYGATTNSARLSIINSCVGTNTITQATDAALRKAVAIGGLVRFCFNGTITLTNTITITRNATLDAKDRLVTINGNNSFRLFTVSPGVTLSVTNLVFINGHHQGADGAAATSGHPPQPGLPGQGGAILVNGGTVQLSSCTILSNSVAGGQGGSGGLFYSTNAASGEGLGGAILVRSGSLSLDAVILESNMASGGPGATGGSNPGPAGSAFGGAIYATNSMVLLANCIVSSNVSMAPFSGNPRNAAFGGAIFQSSGSAYVSNCMVTANVAFGSNVVVNAPVSGAPAYGGGLAVTSGTITLNHSKIALNTASGGNGSFIGTTEAGEAQGGGLFCGGVIWAFDTDFSTNNAQSGSLFSQSIADASGGAVFNLGTGVFNRCSFVSNKASGGLAYGPTRDGLGGGICNYSQLNLTNCTFALNSANGGDNTTGIGGPRGPAGNALGGALYNNGGSVNGMDISMASNLATPGDYPTYGFGGGDNLANTNGTTALANSLIAYPGTNFNAWGTITDLGFNMCSDGSASFNSGSSFNFTDPRLEPVGNYGGFTSTMALQSNSPAVDIGTSAGAPVTDQRGMPRPSGAGVDLGAYELQQSPAQMPVLQIGWSGGNLQLSFAAQPNLIYTLLSSPTFTNWTAVESIGPFPAETNVLRTINPTGTSAALFRLRSP